MKTISKEYNLLSVEDIEEAVSDFLKKKVKISDMECVLTYYVNIDTNVPEGMGLSFFIDGDEVDDFDIFDNEEKSVYEFKNKELSLNEVFLEPDMIFDFDTQLFKSFEIIGEATD